ncbi:toll-like receptor 2 type-2 [Amphiura filiformis]|uniref:toll-like receptor 2 type-2 n=1 Tax=Amphiura filiformis TaxID=82378 RepID=UPI003B210F8D
MAHLHMGPYTCFYPDSEKDYSITQVNLDCALHLWKYILIAIACTIVLISGILIVRYWWHIKYKFFLLFNRRRNQQHHLIENAERIDDDENGPPRYDAYVPYHEESADDWVHGELLPNIEQGEEPFRLFLRCRDMRIGRTKLDEIFLHMQRSRKVLLILSPHFFEDNWCIKELEMAHYRVLEENRYVMIFIILEEIPNNKKTLLFRQLLCKVQCLKWPGD